MFGAVPLNLAITRSAFLKNASQNHAYFKVSVLTVLRVNTLILEYSGIPHLRKSI